MVPNLINAGCGTALGCLSEWVGLSEAETVLVMHKSDNWQLNFQK